MAKYPAQFSIIIPVLNEEKIIGEYLDDIKRSAGDTEIIIVDGGSQDRTADIARNRNLRVFQSQKGRGIQCNCGAQKASGNVFLFLHIDTKLNKAAFEQLNQIFEDDQIQIGTFRMQFDVNHWLLKLYAFFTRFDSIFTSFGDQGIVVRRDFFHAIGGFPEWPFMEDVHFLRCARKCAKINSFTEPVITSSRMFIRNGMFKQQIFNGLLLLRYLLGTHPEKLYKTYYK